MRRKILLISTAVAGFAAIALMLALADTYVTRSKASDFLRDVRELRIGKSSLADLLRLKEKYYKFASEDPAGCDRNSCRIYFSFDNRWLSRLRVVPAARLGGGVTVKHGAINEINLALASDPSYSAQVIETLATPGEPPYNVSGRRSDPNGPFIALKVRLTPDAPQDMRTKAYSFNLSCLTRVGGCKDGRAVLPIA